MGISYEESMKKFATENMQTYSRTRLFAANNNSIISMAEETAIANNKYKYYNIYTDTISATIDNQKNINIAANQVVIAQESNSQYIRFRMSRSYDGVDIPGKNGEDITLSIYFENGNSQIGSRKPINVYYEEDHITFGWLLDEYVTSHSGRIRFEIRAEGTVPGESESERLPYKWKSRINDALTVAESLSGNIELPDEDSPESPSFIAAKVEELEDRVEELEYEPISITVFRHNKSSKIELGETLRNTVLTWKLSRMPESPIYLQLATSRKNAQGAITTSNERINVGAGVNEGSINVNYDIEASIQWSLVAYDERVTASNTSSASIEFLNEVHYGAADEPAEYNREFIEGLSNSKLSSTVAGTLNFTGAGENSYYWYCVPCRLGGCSFMTGGYQGGMGFVDRFEFENDKGYTEWYDIYRNGHPGVSNLTVVVTGVSHAH